MALSDILANLGLIGAQGGQALAQAMQAQGSPLAYQQQQENLRQQQQFAFQNQQRNTLSAYDQAQIGLQQQSQLEQQGRDVWNAIAGGATFAPSGTQPDFYIGGRGLKVPAVDSGYTIPANSEMGKFYGLDRDATGLKPEQYLDAHVKYQGVKQAQQDDTTQQAILDVQKKNARAWLLQRFSPGFSKQMYGRSDPTASMESQNLADEIETAQNPKELAGIMDKARNYRTQWEQHEDKKIDLKNQLDLRAADAATKGDPHYMSAVVGQYHAFDELEKPIQSEWEQGNNIIGFANQRNQQSDALLITAIMPYITGVKRFNQAEISNAQGGATAWGQLQNYLNKYQSDPNSARINEPQRQQIISLLNLKQSSLKASLAKINAARLDMTDATTAAQVLKISAKLHSDLSTVQATPVTGEADWIVSNGQAIRNPRKVAK